MILCYSAKALTGIEAKNIMLHMSILETIPKKGIDLLARNVTDSSSKVVESYTGLNINGVINSVTEFYYDKGSLMKDWEAFYDAVDVSEFSKYEKFFIFSGMDLQGAGLNRQMKRVGSFPKDDGQIGFVSTGRQACNIVALLKAHKLFGTEIHELLYDPNELALGLMHDDFKPVKNYYSYHGYDIPRYGINRLDSLQFTFSKKKRFFEEDKIYDLTFGYTSMRGERDKFQTFIDETVSSLEKTNLYVRDKKKNINTMVDKDTYLNKLEQSRFTIILPSYNETCFSIYRMIEALDADCLPIISPVCRLDEVESSFNVSLKPLVSLSDKTEKTRVELLEYYKEVFLPFKQTFI